MPYFCIREKEVNTMENTTRFIKTVKVTYSDVQKNKVDGKVNEAVKLINENGGKVISFTQILFGAGMSTIYLVYNVIYEAKQEIPAEIFKNKNG